MFPFLLSAFAEETSEETVKAEPGWLETALKKFAETPLTVWIAVGVLIALGIILLTAVKTSGKWTAKMLSFGALSIALSFVLSCIRLYRMPQGGSVTPGSMLPVMLFSATFGVGPGLLVGLVYGVLQFMQGGYFLNVWQVILDYLLAYAALGLTGLSLHMGKSKFFAKLPGKQRPELYIAMIIAALGRALSATLAGVVFWETAPWASLVYNGTYLIPDTLICFVLAFFIARPVMKAMSTGSGR